MTTEASVTTEDSVSIEDSVSTEESAAVRPADPVSAPLRRIGVMGGTFDPIHNGHLVAASEVATEFDLDEVVFVPTGQPWMKSGRGHRVVTEAEHRYLMTVIATASNPMFTVSRVDIDRQGATFTIDTLRDIRAEHPDAQLFFITGADAVAQILDWKDVQELWELAHFVAVSRPGHDLSVSGLPESEVSLLEVPALAISSTDCRSRVGRGSPVWYLVPDGVVQYISKHHLYEDASVEPQSITAPSMSTESVEATVTETE